MHRQNLKAKSWPNRQITDDLERLKDEAAVWRFYAEFERRVSVV